jgi:hypothetical protein
LAARLRLDHPAALAAKFRGELTPPAAKRLSEPPAVVANQRLDPPSAAAMLRLELKASTKPRLEATPAAKLRLEPVSPRLEPPPAKAAHQPTSPRSLPRPPTANHFDFR